MLVCCVQLAIAQSTVFQFVSPKPNSILVSNETNIILRSAPIIDRTSLMTNYIRVEGTHSGLHSGDLILSDDGRTIVFNPHVAFTGNEVVAVTVQSGIKTIQGSILLGFSFSFKTMPQSAQPLRKVKSDAALLEYNTATAALPAPSITIDSLNNPSPGYIFLATWDRNTPLHKYANYIFILDNNGNIIDSTRVNGAPFDFKIQPNGRLSYGLGDYTGITPGNSNLKQYVLDSTLAIVDSFQMKNGYLTDFHDFILLPNGHAMLMSFTTVTYDMSLVAPGGRPDAQIVINVFQEQDADKNVIFEWRDIDYIPITDTDSKLTDPRVDQSTLNAFNLDDDGNLLFSFRNHSAIMKISRETGEIMWRWGGRKNEFTFVGEHQENAPYYFARQHNIKRLVNGNVTLFDNGEFHSPWYSRAAEYKLDEVNKTATLLSEYRYASGNISTQAAGNAAKLSDGGWFVGYGILNPGSQVMRNIVEVHADGSTAFELSLPKNVIAYRVSKQPWRELIQKTLVSNAEVYQGNTYSFNKNGKTTGVSIKYIQLSGDIYNSVSMTRVPYGPMKPEFIADAPIVYPVSLLYEGAAISSHTSEIHIDLKSYPEIKQPNNTSLYMRQFANQGLLLALPTTYDSTANELIATTIIFGEIIFGKSDLRQGQATPLLIEPSDKKKVAANKPLLLKWGGHGLLQSFKIQIATDSIFKNIILDSITTNSFVQQSNLFKDKKYYWRVRANASNDTSKWSSVWSFEPADAFIKVVTPSGGEMLQIGKPFIVRWETNVSDSVKLYVISTQTAKSLLGKTYSENNAFQWNVVTSLSPDTSYKLIVESYLDSTLADTSSAVFTLINPVSVETISSEIPNRFKLFQNYPNPFNPITQIGYSIAEAGVVKLKVYNVLGTQIADLEDGYKEAGRYVVMFDASQLSSGVYFYKITSGKFTSVKKLLYLK